MWYMICYRYIIYIRVRAHYIYSYPGVDQNILTKICASVKISDSIYFRIYMVYTCLELQMNTNFRAFGNVRICSISARWLNLRAFRKKVRVFRLAGMAGKKKYTFWNCAKLRRFAQNCACCCAFLHPWWHNDRNGDFCAFGEIVVGEVEELDPENEAEDIMALLDSAARESLLLALRLIKPWILHE